jgi:hypothetical protein
VVKPRRGDPQVARVVAEDQVQPSGEQRLALTNRGSWTIAAFSEKGHSDFLMVHFCPIQLAGRRSVALTLRRHSRDSLTISLSSSIEKQSQQWKKKAAARK